MTDPATREQRRLQEALESRLTAAADTAAPSLVAARALANHLWLAIGRVYPTLPDGTSRRTRADALLYGFPAFEALLAGQEGRAAARLAEAVRYAARESDSGGPQTWMVAEPAAPMERPRGSGALPVDLSEAEAAEWRIIYSQAVGEILAQELGGDRARTALRSLMTRLELRQDELGRLFGVSGETVRRWERGLTSIPVERQKDVVEVEAGLRRLLEIFRLERLPVVVRREAGLFDGDTALEWILRGRIGEVADRYENAFLYQG